MGLLGWWAKPGADTQSPGRTDLAPLVVPIPPEQAASLVRSVTNSLPGWRVASESPGEFHLRREGWFLGFGYAVVATLKPAGPGTLIHACCRARVGFSPPGRCRRNIQELFAAIRKSL